VVVSLAVSVSWDVILAEIGEAADTTEKLKVGEGFPAVVKKLARLADVYCVCPIVTGMVALSATTSGTVAG